MTSVHCNYPGIRFVMLKNPIFCTAKMSERTMFLLYIDILSWWRDARLSKRLSLNWRHSTTIICLASVMIIFPWWYDSIFFQKIKLTVFIEKLRPNFLKQWELFMKKRGCFWKNEASFFLKRNKNFLRKNEGLFWKNEALFFLKEMRTFYENMRPFFKKSEGSFRKHKGTIHWKKLSGLLFEKQEDPIFWKPNERFFWRNEVVMFIKNNGLIFWRKWRPYFSKNRWIRVIMEKLSILRHGRICFSNVSSTRAEPWSVVHVISVQDSTYRKKLFSMILWHCFLEKWVPQFPFELRSSQFVKETIGSYDHGKSSLQMRSIMLVELLKLKIFDVLL